MFLNIMNGVYFQSTCWDGIVAVLENFYCLISSWQCSSLCSSQSSSQVLSPPDFEHSRKSWQRCLPLCMPSQTRRPPVCHTCAAPPSHCSPSGCSPAPSRSPPDRCRQCHRPPNPLLLRPPKFPWHFLPS